MCHAAAIACAMILSTAGMAGELPDGAVLRFGVANPFGNQTAFRLRFTPDGSRLLAAGSTLQVFDASTGERLQQRNVEMGVFSPDGRVCFSPRAGLVEVDTGKVRWEFKDLPTIRAADFTEDGKTLALSGESARAFRVLWIDAAKGKAIRQADLPGDPAFGFTVAANGSLACACWNQKEKRYQLLLFDANGQQVRAFDGGIEPLNCAAFSSDGKKVAFAGWKSDHLEIRDAATGTGRKIALNPDEPVNGLAFSPDGKVLAGCVGVRGTGTPGLVLWDSRTGKQLRAFLDGIATASAAFAPDGKILAASSGLGTGAIHLLDPETGQPLPQSPENNGPVADVLPLPGNKHVLTRDPAGFRVWDAGTGKQAAFLPAEKTSAFAVSKDGKFLAIGEAAGIRLRELPAASDGKFLPGSEHPRPLAFSEDARTLWAHAGGEVVAWDLTAGKAGKRYAIGNLGGVVPESGLFVNASGNVFLLATGEQRGGVQVLAEEDRSTFGPPAITGILLAPGGKTLVSQVSRITYVGGIDRGQTAISLWEVASGKRLARMAEAPYMVTGPKPLGGFGPLAYSPDGQKFVFAASERLHLISAANGTETWALDLLASALAFSPDGALLAVGLEDGAVSLREAASGKEMARHAGHDKAITALAFSPDGRLLYSGSADSSVVSWKVSR